MQKFDLSQLATVGYDVFYSRYLSEFHPVAGKSNVSLRCCFHDDITPSLSINLANGLYNCYGCGAKGNAIDFIKQKFGLGYNETVKKIEGDFGFDGSVKAASPASKSKSLDKQLDALITSTGLKILEEQLWRNSERLEYLKCHYFLDDNMISKYRLGFQNDKYVIPFETEDAWRFKEHKGIQLKGTKARLYPLDVLSDKSCPIVVTEGEFKALLLIQQGIPAVCGTAGAGTWMGEWSVMLAGRDIYLAFDNDVAGRNGSIKAASSLIAHAKSVSSVVWPFDMLEGYDVTDWFVTLGHTADEFNRLLDHAVSYSDIKELYGVKFEDPFGYVVRPDAVVKVRMYKDKVIEDVVLVVPVVIRSRAVDIDRGNEELEIVYERDNVIRYLYVPRSELYSTREIVKFADIGVNVTSDNAKGVICYLLAYENMNICRIDRKDITRSLGWKTVGGRESFVTGGGGAIEFKAESGFQSYACAVSEKGDYEVWLSEVRKVVQYPHASLVLYASFAAPLLKLVGGSNFVVDLYGQSSVGKTSALILAASVWGNPDRDNGLIFAWDSTKVFFERVATHFCDFPIFPDDSQTVQKDLLRDMLYQVTSGQGKGRGNIKGIREMDKWRTICISTGERPLTECSGHSGVQARVVGLYGSPFSDAGAEVVNHLRRALRLNYGHAGPIYISHLEAIANNPDKLSKLKVRFNECQIKLSGREESVHPFSSRYAEYFAVMFLAIEIVHELFCIEADVAAPMQRLLDVYIDITSHQDHADLGKSAMEKVLDWVYANRSCFSEADTGKEKYGSLVEGKYIAVFPRKLDVILREDGYSPDVVLNLWCDNEHDYLKRNGKNRTVAVRMRELDNNIVRMYAIKWAVVEEFGHE